MLHSIKNRDALEKLNESVSLQNQVKLLGLQDELGKPNFHKFMKKVFQSVTKTIEDASKGETKTMMVTSQVSDKQLRIETKDFEKF